MHHDLLLEALRHVPLLPKKLSVGGENLSLLSMRNDDDDAAADPAASSTAIKWLLLVIN